uniref:Uncharacterized protein n=1 Tax=Arundo donax TaxID=35708 RepID=A0A0A8ZNA0_ARUDO
MVTIFLIRGKHWNVLYAAYVTIMAYVVHYILEVCCMWIYGCVKVIFTWCHLHCIAFAYACAHLIIV